jgi:hypothetical protein
MLNRKRSLILVAAALFVLTTLPAFGQYWGVPGSAGDIDDASETLFDTDGPTLKFKSGQTGTIVARYPVFSGVQDPNWTDLAVNYTGAGVSVKLIGLIYCQKFTDQILSETFPAGESNSCEGASVPTGTWDFSQWTYYVELTLTRSSTATDPQVHQIHFQ